GEELGLPQMLAKLAEVYGKAGLAEEGLRVLAEALAIASRNDEHRLDAELYRLKGELLLAQAVAQGDTPTVSEAARGTRAGAGPVSPLQIEAEMCFWRAIEVARAQQAKSLELRAVMSLSRLQQTQAKGKEARQRLAEVYSWFSEGFETLD